MVIEVWIEIEVRKFRPVQCPVPCTKKLEARPVAKTTGGTRRTGPAQSVCSRNKSVGRFAIAQTSWLILLLFREQPDKSPGNLRLFTTNWTIRKHESVCAGAKGGCLKFKLGFNLFLCSTASSKILVASGFKNLTLVPNLNLNLDKTGRWTSTSIFIFKPFCTRDYCSRNSFMVVSISLQ